MNFKSLLCCVLVFVFSVPAPAFDFGNERRSLLEREEEVRKNPAGLSEDVRLDAFIQLRFDYTLLEHPEFATTIGHPTGQDRWTDNAMQAIERRQQDSARALGVIGTIDPARLTGENARNYELLRRQLEEAVESHRFKEELLAVNQLSGVQIDVPRTLAMMPVRSRRDYRNILARLEGVPKRVDDTLALLRAGLDSGVTPPRVILAKVPEQISALLPREPFDSALLLPFKNFPEAVPAGERSALKNEASRIYRDRLVPAYSRLRAFIERDYLPRARTSVGLKDLPDGPAWYAFKVKENTTTDLPPEKIHELGRREVERIRGRMHALIEETGFQGDFHAFTRFLRTHPRFYYNDPESLLAGYRDIAKRADPELIKLFGYLPRLPYGVTAVPAHAEKSQPAAYYDEGSLAAGRPGYFVANTSNLKSRPRWGMEALTLHEAVPGHHLQISIQQELEGLPWFRRYGGYTAYFEGWALYAETLGYEMGFYRDPYARFGQLDYEMWRAIRLVVDTGIHAMGWSRERAIDFFRSHSAKTDDEIGVEVDRYIVWPGQALTYKIGQLKIQELRSRARTALGERFDVRAFHDRILGQGALPLDLLEKEIDAWIARVGGIPPSGSARAALGAP